MIQLGVYQKWKNNKKVMNLKIYTTLGYIVSLILFSLGHVLRFRIVGRIHVSQVQEDY